MAEEYDTNLQLALERVESLYEILLAPEVKHTANLNQLVKNIQDTVTEIPNSAPEYDDGQALSQFANLATRFFSLFILLDDPKRTKVKSELRSLQTRLDAGGYVLSWIQEATNDIAQNLKEKVKRLLIEVLEKLSEYALYQPALDFIQFLESKNIVFEELIIKKTKFVDLIHKFKTSLFFNINTVGKLERESEVRKQLERVQDLVDASPDDPNIKALLAKASKDYNKILENKSKDVDKAHELLEAAQRVGNWDDVRDQANLILFYINDDEDAQAIKAEADAHQASIAKAKKGEIEILRLIAEGKISEADRTLQKLLHPIPEPCSDIKINELFLLRDFLSSFQVKWDDLLQYVDQNEYSPALLKSQALLDDQENRLPLPIRDLLEKKVVEWRSGEKAFVEAGKLEQGELVELRSEFKKAKQWNALYAVRQKVLVLSGRVRNLQIVQDAEKLQQQIENALDSALAEEVEIIVLKTGKNFQSTARTLDVVTPLLGDGKLDVKEEGIDGVRRFFTEAGRKRHQVVIENLQKGLEEYSVTSNDWLEQAQRALDDGRLTQASRYAEKAGKIGKDKERKAQTIIRDVQSQQDTLTQIRQIAAISVTDAKTKLADFISKHDRHTDAKRLERELEFNAVDDVWSRALTDRELQKQKDLVNSAILLAPNLELRKFWQDKKVELLNIQEDYNNAQHFRLEGKLSKAVSLLERVKKFDKRADAQIDEINHLILQMDEASQAIKDEKYDLGIRFFEEIKKQISLPDVHEKELRKAYFEYHQKEAKDSLQIYDLDAVVRNLEIALRYSPKQNIKAIKIDLENYRSLLFEVKDWEKKVRSFLNQGAELEVKRSLDAAKGRYGDAFAIQLGKQAEGFIEKIYPALRTELIDSTDRVDRLIELKKRIDNLDSDTDDPEAQLKMYNQYLELSMSVVPEYKKQADKLDSILKERRKYKSEFEIIRTKLESDDIEQLGQAFKRIEELEKEIINAGDSYLTSEYAKLSREAHKTRTTFKEYKGFIDEAQRLISEAQYQPAMAVLQRAENVRNTPEVQGLKSEIASSIERQLVIADQFKLVENRMQEGDWRGANEILIQIAAIGPSDTSQKAQLASLRDRVSEEIEKSDALKRHFEIMLGLLSRFDYEESDKQLGIARERFGNRLEFIEIEREIEQVRQNCIRLDDLLRRANEAYARNRLRESETLYNEARLIPNADEIIKIKGWHTIRTGDSVKNNDAQSESFWNKIKKNLGS